MQVLAISEALRKGSVALQWPGTGWACQPTCKRAEDFSPYWIDCL